MDVCFLQLSLTDDAELPRERNVERRFRCYDPYLNVFFFDHCLFGFDDDFGEYVTFCICSIDMYMHMRNKGVEPRHRWLVL